MTLDKMTDANKIMNPQYFGSDPADIGCETEFISKSGLESQITCSCGYMPWQRSALSECSLVTDVAGIFTL